MKDTDEIFKEMASELETRTGVKLNTGGDMALRLYAVAAELASLWAQADWLKMQAFPQTATGEYLDLHAQMRGLTRGQSVCATGTVRFETEEQAISQMQIPEGTVCMNAAGTEFITTAAGVIEAGDSCCDVAAKARQGGGFGNVPSGSICFMSLAPVGVTACSNPQAFSGGADAQSDDELRQRVIGSYASLPNGSNSAYYEQTALETDGVAAAKVLPKERGLGTVDVVISGADGLPSQALLEAVQTRLDAEREICVDIEVSAPTAVTVDITAQIDVAADCDETQTVAAVKNAIENMFDGTLLGKSVFLAKLGSVIYAVPGVENYAITAPATDIAVTQTQLPVAGTVTVTGR